MSISTQNTVVKDYICYKLFAAYGELGDIVTIYNTMRVPCLLTIGETNHLCSHL